MSATYAYRPMTFTVGTILLTASIAAGGSLAENLPLEVVYQAKEPIVTPVTAVAGHAAVEMPTVPVKPGKILCIRFRALYPVDTYIAQLASIT